MEKKDSGSKAKIDPKSESVWRNGLKIAMPMVVPWILKIVSSLVPEGSRIDKYLEVFHETWIKFLPFISALVLQITKMPEWVDDIVAELQAEVIRTLKERYGKDGKDVATKSAAKTAENETVLIIASTLEEGEFKKFWKLVASLDNEDQRINFLNYLISVKTGNTVLANWAKMGNTQFQILVNSLVPIPKQKVPREPSKLEKEVKKSFNEFKEDGEAFLKKKSWLQKWSEEVDRRREEEKNKKRN